jgi:hypothetical protein
VWLAREACNDEIHESTPRSPVEGLDVSVDGSAVEMSVRHSGSQYPLAVSVKLDVADCFCLRVREFESKIKASYACK